MRPLLRWTILIAALLFVMGGGYFALKNSGGDDPVITGTDVETPPAPDVGKHGQGPAIDSGFGGGVLGAAPARFFHLPRISGR